MDEMRFPEPLAPFFRWTGGKQRLLRSIMSILPDNARELTYYEPFLGGGAVLLGLQPEKAIISDVNPNLMAAWHAVKENPEKLWVILAAHGIAHEADPEGYYYIVRDMYDPRRLDLYQKGARFIYLTMNSFNALWRVNKKGMMNAPWSKKLKPQLPSFDALLAAGAYLKGHATIRRLGGYTETCSDASVGSLVYFDPPYLGADGKNEHGYNKEVFDYDSWRGLVGFSDMLAARGAKVMISSSDDPRILKLFKAYKYNVLLSQKTNGGANAARGTVRELLIYNW
jgi:DNA adenine methylase